MIIFFKILHHFKDESSDQLDQLNRRVLKMIIIINAECIGTCVMAFPFSGRLRCYQHSQGDDKRELGSPIRHSVTHPTFSGPGRVRVSSSEFDWLPSIDTFYYCHTIPIESNSIKLLLISQAIKPFTHSL